MKKKEKEKNIRMMKDRGKVREHCKVFGKQTN